MSDLMEAAKYFRKLSQPKMDAIKWKASSGDNDAALQLMEVWAHSSWTLRQLGFEIGETGRLVPWKPMVLSQYWIDMYEQFPETKPDLTLTREKRDKFNQEAREWVDSIMLPHIERMKHDDEKYETAKKHRNIIISCLSVCDTME